MGTGRSRGAGNRGGVRAQCCATARAPAASHRGRSISAPRTSMSSRHESERPKVIRIPTRTEAMTYLLDTGPRVSALAGESRDSAWGQGIIASPASPALHLRSGVDRSGPTPAALTSIGNMPTAWMASAYSQAPWRWASSASGGISWGSHSDDDVLAFAGGEEEPDFRGVGANEPRERRSHLIGAREHVAERDRLPSFTFGEHTAGLDHRPRGRRDVGRIEVELFGGSGEVVEDAQRVGRTSRLRRRPCRRQRSEGRQRGEKTATIDGHITPLRSRLRRLSCAARGKGSPSARH